MSWYSLGHIWVEQLDKEKYVFPCLTPSLFSIEFNFRLKLWICSYRGQIFELKVWLRLCKSNVMEKLNCKNKIVCNQHSITIKYSLSNPHILCNSEYQLFFYYYLVLNMAFRLKCWNKKMQTIDFTLVFLVNKTLEKPSWGKP